MHLIIYPPSKLTWLAPKITKVLIGDTSSNDCFLPWQFSWVWLLPRCLRRWVGILVGFGDRFQVFPNANRTLPLVHPSKSISKCLHYHRYGAKTVISNRNWIARIKWEQWKSSSVMMMLNMVENGASGLKWWSISVDIAGCRGVFWGGFQWLHAAPPGVSGSNWIVQRSSNAPERRLHPGKWTAGHLKIHRFCQGKSSEPNLHECVPC